MSSVCGPPLLVSTLALSRVSPVGSDSSSARPAQHSTAQHSTARNTQVAVSDCVRPWHPVASIGQLFTSQRHFNHIARVSEPLRVCYHHRIARVNKHARDRTLTLSDQGDAQSTCHLSSVQQHSYHGHTPQHGTSTSCISRVQAHADTIRSCQCTNRWYAPCDQGPLHLSRLCVA
jgi:hypothetical protein